jgi:hypothetical protein
MKVNQRMVMKVDQRMVMKVNLRRITIKKMKNKPYLKIGVNSLAISFMHTVVVIAYYIIKLLIVKMFFTD